MTSPAQLQYLNAMGIPVWVSRELVIDEALKIDETQSEYVNTSPNRSTREKSGTHSTNTSGVSNAVDNILQELQQKEEESKVTKSSPVNESPSEAIRKITESLDTEPKVTNRTQVNIPNVFAKTEHHTVYAEGNLDADWMVIGQNPEFIEHEQGQPFTREEGVLLENMVRALGIKRPRNDAYLVNVLRNSHRNDSDAQTSKIELNAILQDCIKQVQPKIIVIVGQLAAQNVLHSDEPLARLRGKPFTLPDSNTYIVVTYYPSYLLNKPADKRKAWEDLKLAISLVAES
ncbi:uracil-DNA glycosylase family protein [uncultured Cocleimonas sp.]|uniref:uracil-DNA glycosylase family protein n=1 Tax=uncultured Cocleimonas sp. TaxID=1051587 RepID=UPI002634020C|nr:uracil-DNA glycosylase family protein [uncultured Cocleimonas sp.]